MCCNLTISPFCQVDSPVGRVSSELGFRVKAQGLRGEGATHPGGTFNVGCSYFERPVGPQGVISIWAVKILTPLPDGS